MVPVVLAWCVLGAVGASAAVAAWRALVRRFGTRMCGSSAGKRRCDEPVDPRCAAHHCTFHCSLYCGGACVRVWELREHTRAAIATVEGATPPRKPPAARLATRNT